VTAPRRDRAALGSLVLAVLGALLLVGILLALLLPGGGGEKPRRAAPATTTQPETTTVPPPPTAPSPPTTAPPTTAPPAPTGPLRAVAVGAFSATVQWAGPDPPASVGYGLPDLGPTMWAPLQGGRATLTGLRYATAYRVWAGDGSLDLTTAGVPASPFAATRGGSIVLDGQPVFPLAVVAQCPSGYQNSLDAGISLFAGNDCGGIAEQTDVLAGRAFSLTNADEAGIGGAGVIGWYYPDEADLKGLTAATLPRFPTLAETARLRVLTLSNHFYSRTAPLAAGRRIYPGLISKADVVAFDLYPLQEFCKASWLSDVAASQRELIRLARGRPTFQWIEARTWKCPQASLRVTPATVRLESWLSVIGGARGIGFFPADWDPGLTPAIARIAREVAALGGALLAPETPASAAAPVLATARSLGGAVYVVAANPTRRFVRAAIQASGLAGRPVEVLEEGRTIASSGDSFEDGFAPFAVHLYVAKP
jgi:hypothetical protein